MTESQLESDFMSDSRMGFCQAITVIAVWLVVGSVGVAQSPVKELKIVSFNIRYGTAADGENHWKKRRDFVIDTIKELNPDLLGTQETLGFQRDFLAEKLGDYDCLGVGRDDGKDAGEMMALFYRKTRFEKQDGGHFWLSETPEKAGSKSWDSSLPRMVTWVKLRDKEQANGLPILFLNTHFDHQGPIARLESAKLIRLKAVELGRDCLIVITGDFNADEGSPPYEALFSAVDGKESPVIDSFRQFHPQKSPDEGTFSSFKPTNVSGSRIDWIAVSRGWQVQSAEIIRAARDGRTPSDHFPVAATVKYK
ncbi:MAG: endonuclease/exonuclease/phosphatase family protein [Pirellulaceae bacterium]